MAADNPQAPPERAVVRERSVTSSRTTIDIIYDGSKAPSALLAELRDIGWDGAVASPPRASEIDWSQADPGDSTGYRIRPHRVSITAIIHGDGAARAAAWERTCQAVVDHDAELQLKTDPVTPEPGAAPPRVLQPRLRPVAFAAPAGAPVPVAEPTAVAPTPVVPAAPSPESHQGPEPEPVPPPDPEPPKAPVIMLVEAVFPPPALNIAGDIAASMGTVTERQTATQEVDGSYRGTPTTAEVPVARIRVEISSDRYDELVTELSRVGLRTITTLQERASDSSS